MSAAIVVDASIVVKWFVLEEDSEKAIEIRDKYVTGEIKLIAPEIMIFEVLNALYYKGLFSINELKEISEALDAFSFELYPLEGEYSRKTIEIAYENSITIYDASYIALAVLKSAHIYTADIKLKEKLKDKYFLYVRTLT